MLVSGRWEHAVEVAAFPPPDTASLARNLLLVHSPNLQSRSDWEGVQKLVRERAPDIDVRIITNGKANPVTRRWQASRPSLVFSPARLRVYRPDGGKIYAGRRTNKALEMQRLAEAGLPVPPWTEYRPDTELDPAEWGEFVIAKPDNDIQGRGVRLLRTRNLARDHAGVSAGGRRYILQRYVDNRDRQGRQYEYRVTTILGAILFADIRRATPPRPPLDEIADNPEGIIILGRGIPRTRELTDEADVLELGARVAAAMAEYPVLGIDILREHAGGELRVLETNTGGDVWHISSEYGLTKVAPDFNRARYAQFDALSVAADQLIARTRSEAI